MAEKTDSVENIIDYGIDIKNRRIYFGSLKSDEEDATGSSFDWCSVERTVRAIHIMETEAPNKPIELHMSSFGGDAYALLRLHDIIQSCSCQIKFFGSGPIMSAATWIMACCDERYLYPNTRILIHDSPAGVTSEMSAKLTDLYIECNEEKTVQDILNKVYADNSRMPVEFWNEIVKRDLYLSAEEAIMLGLADEIIKPKKRGNLRRQRIAHLNKKPDTNELNILLGKLSARVSSEKSLKIELHVPKERFDQHVVIDQTLPENSEVAQDSLKPAADK